MKTLRINIKRASMVLASALVLGGSTLISGCTTSDNELVVENDKTPSVQKAGTFTFQLNGTKARSSFAPVSRAEEENPHAFEGDIKTVYVAFFTQKENTEESTLRKLYTDESGDDGADPTITKAKDGNSYTITDENLFTGDYIVYFIANPGTKLKASLKDLTPGTSKLSEFKAISIEEDTPNGGDTKDSKNGTGFVMISDEMNITITEDKTISNITMTRLGARFDIINTQPTTGEDTKHGATITNVTITNEAVKSDLIVPAANTNANYLSTKEATQWTKDATDMTFYTYENFPKTEEQNNNTSLTVTYALDGSQTSKTLTIYLTDKNTGTQLGVKRNHLYSIYLNCVTGQYTLDVKDWDAGETVNLPDKNIYVEYTEKDLGKIGDYAYKGTDGKLVFSDGGLRKMYLNGKLDWVTRPSVDPNKGTCIGIVFSNMTSATDYGSGYTHGYIMALKDAGTNLAWGNAEKMSDLSATVNTIGEATLDLDGLSHYNEIKNTDGDFSNHPAFKAIADYNVDLPTSGTSKWYMPSYGQIAQIYYYLGNYTTIKSNESSTTSITNRYRKALSTGESASIANNINNKLSGVGNDNYSPITVVQREHWFMTSTQAGTTTSPVVLVNYPDRFEFAANIDKAATNQVCYTRAVLAW
ncbi:hypothetical protein [Phocaeicola sp.]